MERNARRERTAESLALEEPHQPKEPLAVDTKPILSIEEPHQLESLGDTKQTLAHQEKPRNGYTVSAVNRASATEILPLLQSLLVQNDIQRVCVMCGLYIYPNASL